MANVFGVNDLPLPWSYDKEGARLVSADGVGIDYSLDTDVFDEVKRFEAKAVNCHAALRDALTECLALIKDMSPGVGRISLQDYQRFNEAPIAAQRALALANASDKERARMLTAA